MDQCSIQESFVHLKQNAGPHDISIGVYTIDAKGVPLLLGVRTLEIWAPS